MAKDSPRELESLALHPVGTRLYEAKPSGKLDGILKSVAEYFQEAKNPSEKKEALSTVAPFVRYAEVTRHIPGLSHYYYKAARYYAKIHGADRRATAASEIRVKYDKRKIGSFVTYITYPHVVFDLPFGTVKVTTTKGETSEIPRLVRTMRNERIVEQYLNFLKENQQEDMSMSRSSLLRILHYCTADHRKSLHELDYYAFAGTEGFDMLIQIVKGLNEPTDFKTATTQLLQESKQYIKGDFKLHIKSVSRVGDHCMQWALSEPDIPALQTQCQGHGHTDTVALYCDRCE